MQIVDWQNVVKMNLKKSAFLKKSHRNFFEAVDVTPGVGA